MVSEYSSVYKHSWCVSIELRTYAAQLKDGGKKCNYVCNFVLCSPLHLSYKNSSLINAFWFATSRRFILRSAGKAEVTVEISLKCIEVNCSFVLDFNRIPFRHFLKQNTSHLPTKFKRILFVTSLLLACLTIFYKTRCTSRQGPWVLLMAAQLVLLFYQAVILPLHRSQDSCHLQVTTRCRNPLIIAHITRRQV